MARPLSSGSSRAARTSLALGLVALTLVGSDALAADPFTLSIKVIHARPGPGAVDPKLEKLAKELSALKKTFKSFELKDEAAFKLEKGSAGRMQLPGGAWMIVRAKERLDGNKLRLELEVKKLDFKATVVANPKATLVVAGPKHDGGRLLLAVERPGKKQ